MNIGELIEVKANYNKLLDQKLLEMVCFFQENLWDGDSDENDPKFISKDDFDALEALTDKISHMVYNIGCPSSVFPMIESIITRKLKHWQASDTIETDDRTYHAMVIVDGKKKAKKFVTKGHRKGKQLKTRSEKIIVLKSTCWMHQIKGSILTGHFRWNNRGYILSYRATDLLEIFYLNNFINH